MMLLVLQALTCLLLVTADTGSTTANTQTDTLTIAGGADIVTSVVGDTDCLLHLMELFQLHLQQ